jgi:hypothetical protein
MKQSLVVTYISRLADLAPSEQLSPDRLQRGYARSEADKVLVL